VRASLDNIQDFLACKRIALVGISRDPADFSAKLFEEFRRQGYEVVLVNPNATDVQGWPCVANVRQIHPPVEAALLLTTPAITMEVVRECAEAGIKRVWMYRSHGEGAVNLKAVHFCEERGIRVIPGQCPFMFLADVAAVHKLHAFVSKVTGRFPKHSNA
jgi:predicted CoA-binding protein